MSYKVHRLEINMEEDAANLETFLSTKLARSWIEFAIPRLGRTQRTSSGMYSKCTGSSDSPRR
jgi:hypothetical protein